MMGKLPVILISLTAFVVCVFILIKILPNDSNEPNKHSSKQSSKLTDKVKIVEVETLERHNFYRERHNVPPLVIDQKLNEVSRNWAIKLAKYDMWKHNPDGIGVYGENLYKRHNYRKKIDPKVLGETAVDGWYSETIYLDFHGTEENMTASTAAYHLTQLLWKASKKMGQAASFSTVTGHTFVVCNYDPPGNKLYKFKENVLPPKN